MSDIVEVGFYLVIAFSILGLAGKGLNTLLDEYEECRRRRKEDERRYWEEWSAKRKAEHDNKP